MCLLHVHLVILSKKADRIVQMQNSYAMNIAPLEAGFFETTDTPTDTNGWTPIFVPLICIHPCSSVFFNHERHEKHEN